MEWQLDEIKNGQYNDLLHSAQEIEATIGSTNYNLYKLLGMRRGADVAIKEWWEQVIKDLNLDNKLDYMIDKNGVIKEVPRNKPVESTPESNVGNNVNELK